MLEIQAIGNLGGNAKVIEWNGKKFLSFSVGITEKRKKSASERVEVTTWVDCTMNHSEIFEKLLVKGKKVFVRGSVSTSIWTKETAVGVNVKCRIKDILLL